MKFVSKSFVVLMAVVFSVGFGPQTASLSLAAANENADGNSDLNADGSNLDPKPHEKHNILETEVLPAVYLDFTHGRQIINLTPAKNSWGPFLSLISSLTSGFESLEYKNYRDGFKVIDNGSFEAGVGPSLQFTFKNATGLADKFWAQVGLIPLVGREIKTVRYARDEAAVTALKSMRWAPYHVADVMALSKGDQVSYASRGGILFFANSGAPAPGVSISVLAAGEFQTYVEKIDEDNVFVKISDVKVRSLGLQAGTIVSWMGATNFSRYTKSLSFLVNIRDREGAMAYEDLVRGNVVAAQKVAARSDAVRRWEKITSRQMGSMSNFFIGIPAILNVKFNEGQINEFSLTQSLHEDVNLRATYGTYLKERKGTSFGKHRDRTEAFYGSSFHITNARGQETGKGILGQYVWNYSSDSTSPARLMNGMAEIAEKTGYRKLLLRAPQQAENLGFESLTFKATFGEEDLRAAMNNASSFSLGRIQSKARQLLRAYKAAYPKAGSEDCDQVRNNLGGACDQTLEQKTLGAAEEMYVALRTMKAALAAKNDRKFTDASARFGKAMMENQAAFKLAVLLAGEGVQAEYVVEGRDVSRYTLTLSSGRDAGFVRATKESPIP
ncbi:MAG TPA: hypothetical protein VIH99_00160 [Bdellovibrionota bacterium]